MLRFAHCLALELGIADVQGMLRAMSYTQLCAWLAYYRRQPWGGVRTDLQAGLVTSAIYNVNRDSSKHREPWGPDDFVLFRDSPEESSAGPQSSAKRQKRTVNLSTEEGWNTFTTYMKMLGTAQHL